MERKSGILLPVFSLPNKYGIGSFGKESYNFIDLLKEAKQKVWQVLPLVQTGYGDSPYSSMCSYSFNPYFISLEELKEEKLLTIKELKSAVIDEEYINYEKLYNTRYSLLRKAYSRFDKQNQEFKRFVKNGRYKGYALFSAIKTACNYKPLLEWEKPLKERDKIALKKFEKENQEEILFWQFLQFYAEKQWLKLKKYANDKGVSIMGDIPLYVAGDSVDVWENPELFKVDENLNPTKIAGVPPDYFCEKGQLWGNPVYDYDNHKKDGFKWWKNRLKKALKIYDYIRIDHFRGLDRFYEIEAGAIDATNGVWVNVPSTELFSELHKAIKKDRIIAEDLGVIDDGVRNLLKEVGYPGMKVLSFAFNGDENNLYLPKNIEDNSVCYTGTHDNDTLLGLINGFSEWDYNNFIAGVKESLKQGKIKNGLGDINSCVDAVIELGFSSKSNLFIMPLHDLLKKDTSYRVNEPGVVKMQNWAIKYQNKDFCKRAFNKLKTLTEKYGR